MKCDCDDQPAIRRIDGTFAALFPGFQRVDAAEWRALLRCRTCGQLWAVDEWDKYQSQFAVKVNTTEGWECFRRGSAKGVSRSVARGECGGKMHVEWLREESVER